MDPDGFARRWNEAANGLDEADRVRANGLYQSQLKDELINRIGQLQDKLLEEAEEGNAYILEAPIPAHARWLELQTQQFIDNAVRLVMSNPSPALQEVLQIPQPVAQVIDTLIWNHQERLLTQVIQHKMAQVLNRAFEHNHQESVFPVIDNRSSNNSPPSLISTSSSDEDLTRNYQDYNTTPVKAWQEETQTPNQHRRHPRHLPCATMGIRSAGSATSMGTCAYTAPTYILTTPRQQRGLST
jgi:hypothetical protein